MGKKASFLAYLSCGLRFVPAMARTQELLVLRRLGWIQGPKIPARSSKEGKPQVYPLGESMLVAKVQRPFIWAWAQTRKQTREGRDK